MKAKSRIQTKRRRDEKGKFTANMSWKDRIFVLSILLGSIMWGYHNHTNYLISANTSDVIVESGEEPATPSAEVQTVSVPVLQEPVEAPELSQKEQIIAYIVEVFGEDSADVITMIRKCENSTFEQERGNHNSNGTYDKGVMQINSIHLSGAEFPVCKEAHNDWRANIDCGKAIFDKYTLSAWSCSHEVGVTPFYEK